MSPFMPEQVEVVSQIDAHLGTTTIKKGDRIGLVSRGDGLFNVLINNQKIGWAIDAEYVNRLAGRNQVPA